MTFALAGSCSTTAQHAPASLLEGIALPGDASPTGRSNAFVCQRQAVPVEAILKRIQEAIHSVRQHPIALKPCVVMLWREWIVANRLEVGHGARSGKEMIAEGFCDSKITNDPGAHAHGHGFQSGRR